MLDRIEQWYKRLDKWLDYSYIILAVAGCLITFEVVCRYAFNAPHTWFEEVTVELVLLGAFLGMFAATVEKGQVSIDLIYCRFNKRTRRVADIVFAIATIIITGFLIVCLLLLGFYLDSVGSHHDSELATPFSWLCYIIAVGMFLAVVGSVRVLLLRLGKAEEEEFVIRG